MTMLPERHLVSQGGLQVAVSDKHVAYAAQILSHLALQSMNHMQKKFLNLFEKSFFLKSSSKLERIKTNLIQEKFYFIIMFG